MATRTARKRKWRLPRKTARRPARKKTTAGGRKKSGARAIWKGRVTFGSVDLPVKLYSAVTDKSIHFRLLDAARKEPVKQHMVDPKSGDVVPNEQVHSAYETSAGELVLLDDDELEAAEPKESRDIELTRFVATDEIPSAWYDRPYYLGPDGDSTGRYFALAKALAGQNKTGIARWVMRKKEYAGALKAEGDYLVLITLRNAGEVVPASALPSPGGRDLAAKEVDMAKQLVEAMRGDFDMTDYRDTYRDRVLGLVEAKAAGKVVKFPKAPKRETPKSLADVLEKSLAAAKRRKSA